MKKKFASLFLGLVLIMLGALFIIDQFFWKFNFKWFDLWPLIIILPCIYNMFASRINMLNSIGAAIGIVFILRNFNFIPKNINIWVLLLSIIIIIIGLSLIIGSFQKNNNIVKININSQNKTHQNQHQNFSYSDTVEQTAFFWGIDIANKSQNFNGAKLSAVFGGIDADFSGALINHDITINTTAIFGGVDIFLPANVNVIVKRSAVFGGVDCPREGIQIPNAPTVYVYSSAVFGGIDIS